ncbi:MAG: hypothetical protein M1287_01190, partial [Firmicutes bacterium]|nr:hypothetical protein [Bacillota bacterium]
MIARNMNTAERLETLTPARRRRVSRRKANFVAPVLALAALLAFVFTGFVGINAAATWKGYSKNKISV